MNTIIFLAGIGIGALVVCILFIMVIASCGGLKETRERAARQGEESLMALKERNEISREMLEIMRNK